MRIIITIIINTVFIKCNVLPAARWRECVYNILRKSKTTDGKTIRTIIIITYYYYCCKRERKREYKTLHQTILFSHPFPRCYLFVFINDFADGKWDTGCTRNECHTLRIFTRIFSVTSNNFRVKKIEKKKTITTLIYRVVLLKNRSYFSW